MAAKDAIVEEKQNKTKTHKMLLMCVFFFLLLKKKGAFLRRSYKVSERRGHCLVNS